MGQLAGLVAAEILWLGQLHPKLCPHAEHREGYTDDRDKESQLDLSLLAVAQLVDPPLSSTTFHSSQTSTLSCHPCATLLILLYKEVGPHTDLKWPEPKKYRGWDGTPQMKIREADNR